MEATIWWWILWILISDYPWPWGQLKIKTKPFNIFLLQINRSINSLSMTTIISNRSIGSGLHFQDQLASWGAGKKRLSASFPPPLPLNLFCLFITLKCYFQQLLSYKYLLFFFSSFPPGEKGRGPIENSALSLSGEFKCGSNNRFLLLFFFKFPVVLLRRSTLRENRKGILVDVLYSQMYGTDTDNSPSVCCIWRTTELVNKNVPKRVGGDSNFGSRAGIFNPPLTRNCILRKVLT